MQRAKGRLLKCLCCLLVLAGLSGSAIRMSVPLETPSRGEEPLVAPNSDTFAGPPLAEQPGINAAAQQPSGASGPEAAPVPSVTEVPVDPEATQATGGENDNALKGTPVVASKVSAPLGPPGPWQLVFDDEFDFLNPAVWTPYWFTDCQPESKKNGVKTCSSNVKVANGEALLQLSDPASGALLTTNPRDGAPGHVGFQYTTGYVEARIYFPGTCSDGLDNWPAWWTTGQNYPTTGEIDIAEPLKGTMSTVYHSPNGHPAKWFVGCYAGAYHTYGVHRKVGANDIYFDGKLVFSYSTTDGNAPHYLILNVGLWGDRQTLGPDGAVKVDWVRAWQ
jgi:hypothetical protein